MKLEEDTVTSLALITLIFTGTVLVLLSATLPLTEPPFPMSAPVVILVQREQTISTGTARVSLHACTLLFQRPHTANPSASSPVNQLNSSTGTELVSQNVLHLLF